MYLPHSAQSSSLLTIQRAQSTRSLPKASPQPASIRKPTAHAARRCTVTNGCMMESVPSLKWAADTNMRCRWTAQPKYLSVSTMASLPGTVEPRPSTCIHRVLSLLLLHHHPPTEHKATGVERKVVLVLRPLLLALETSWALLPHSVSATRVF